eukprot:TRINITY_DN17790_c0_g1_i1.p1 TRINITY_DN17790_c0_g1~~TRINITY_DN17790_c0_g1_i1.p1  ORF type:complete len:307 (+),score=130.11 TRINITY_DN17790_c0_g1_i1:49-969(+)
MSSSKVDVLAEVPEVKPGNFTHAPASALLFNLLHFTRIVGAWTFALTTVWILWFFTPLLLLNGTFRKLNIPERYFPLEVLVKLYAKGCVTVGGLRVIVENPYAFRTPSVVVSNHLSRLDPFLTTGWTPEPVKFIMKKELVWQLPMIMGLGVILGHITIDRGSKDTAIQKMKLAAKKVKDANCNIAVYPEGTRSVTGKLQPFKKGAFHIAKDSGATIAPVLVFGTWDFWRPHTAFFRPGVIKYKFLKPIENTPEKTPDDLLREARKAMVQGLKEETFVPHDYDHVTATIPAFTWLAVFSAFVFYFFF